MPPIRFVDIIFWVSYRKLSYFLRYAWVIIMNNRKLFFVPGLFAALIIIFVLSFSLKTNAKENKTASVKIYTSIIIEEGDSLWSIAKDNKPDNVSVNEYISHIKKINQLNTDKIHAGNFLTIYYYEER